MPDYTSILRRSISALPDASPQMREAVYQRARAALARQLTAVDPPLSPHDIEAQQQQLEDAVAAIEAEHASTTEEEPDFVSFDADEPFRQEPPSAPARQAAPPPPPPRQETPPAPPRQGPPSQPRRDAAPAQQHPQLPRVGDFNGGKHEEEKRRPDERQTPRQRPEQDPAEPRVVPAHPAPRDEDRRPARTEEPRPEPQQRPERRTPVRQEPQVRPSAATAAAAAPAAPAARAEPDDADERIPGFLEEDETRVSRARLDRGPGDKSGPRGGYSDDDGEGRRSRAPALIALALLLLLVVGGGALLYAQRDALVGLFGSDDSGTQQASVGTEAPSSEASSDAAGKRPDRLTNGVASSDATEPDTAQQPAPPTGEAATPAPPDAAPSEPSPSGTPAIPNVIPPSPPQSGAQGLVAQRAIFYEQGGEGTPGRATEGTIAWSEVDGQDGTAAIQANIEVPERNLQAVITITRNSDSSLPASHLVEVQLVGTASLGSGAVERVPALVMKPNEQARGQPLAGAAVPVTDSLFWIALSDDPEQVTRNLTLMREGSWFDLPVLFEGGKRALLTFEKGVPGDRVFETVLAEWSGG